eukprot:4338916-Pyramimonas_sp.AAC.1
MQYKPEHPAEPPRRRGAQRGRASHDPGAGSAGTPASRRGSRPSPGRGLAAEDPCSPARQASEAPEPAPPPRPMGLKSARIAVRHRAL